MQENTYLRWFEGVVCRKMKCQKEYTTSTLVVIRSCNCGLPMKHIPNWTYRTLYCRVTGQITKFLMAFQAIVGALRLDPHYLDVCSKVRPKLLIISAARKDCLLVSQWPCQTQALGTEAAGISGEPRVWLIEIVWKPCLLLICAIYFLSCGILFPDLLVDFTSC